MEFIIILFLSSILYFFLCEDIFRWENFKINKSENILLVEFAEIFLVKINFK